MPNDAAAFAAAPVPAAVDAMVRIPVLLLGLSLDAGTVADLCAMAEALACAFDCAIEVQSSEDPPRAALAVAVLPTGSAAGPAAAALLGRFSGACPVLVAIDREDVAALPTLVAWGAADVVLRPCAPIELVARARRVLGLRGAASVTAMSDAMAPAAGGAPAPSAGRARIASTLVGSGPAFLRQLDRLEQVAACDAGVLILGETGTGKELFAQAVHYASRRAGKPMVAVNCGAIPHDLVEDELFGHVRGAYTTALGARSGLVREAEGGSLFLDDVDCLPLAAQAKLLRFLQEREYRPVGSNAVQRADVRVIAATNRDLSALAAQGHFRSDLFYRLNVLTLALPALRERREDIAALALHFVRRHARQAGRRVQGISPAALRWLLAHDWPGNVRELQHAIERAVLLGRGGTIEAADLDVGAGADGGAVDADADGGDGTGDAAVAAGLHGASRSPDESFKAMKARVVENFERSYIEALLSSSHGNIADAARAAGKHRRAFFELIRKHHISAERFREVRRGG